MRQIPLNVGEKNRVEWACVAVPYDAASISEMNKNRKLILLRLLQKLFNCYYNSIEISLFSQKMVIVV